MALNFHTIKVLSEQPGGSLVGTPYIGNEPSNDIYQYYVDNNFTADKQSKITLSDYDLSWELEKRSLTSRRVEHIGIKTFPQIGAIGFYVLYNEERSKIVVPIHAEERRYEQPLLEMNVTADSLDFTISDPDKLEYVCYRIVIRLGNFATEYVTYEKTLSVPLPYLSGEYSIYCVGYLNEGEAVSEDSNIIEQFITGTGVNPVPTNDVYVVGATFDNGVLALTMSNGEIVRSTNSVLDSDEWRTLSEALGVNDGFSGPLYEHLGGDDLDANGS